MSNHMPTRLPRSYKDIHYDNEFKISKRWYYEGEGRKYISGNLNDSLELDCFISDNTFAQKIIPEIKSSNGKTTIRLIDCICRNADVLKNLLTPATKKRQMTITPFYAVIAKKDSPDFRKVWNITGYLPGLDQWLGVKLTDFDYGTLSFNNGKYIHSIKLDSNTIIEISSELIPDYSTILSYSQFTMQNEQRVTIKFLNTPKDFKYGISLFSLLENFSSFLFSTSYQNSIFTYKPNNDNRNNITYAKVFGRKNNKYKPSWGPLFTVNDLTNKNIVKDILIQWIFNYQNIQESIEALLIYLDNNISDDMKFISLISSLESLYRYVFKEKKYPKDEWNNIRQNILSYIPDKEYKDIVEKRLTGPPETSLREKLKNLVKIGNDYNLSTFNKPAINKLVNTRNYYTHRDKSRNEKVLSGWELTLSNEAMTELIKLLILKMIGIPDSDLKNIVSKSYRFNLNIKSKKQIQ